MAYIVGCVIAPTFSGGIFGFIWASRAYSRGRVEGPLYATVTINTGFSIAAQISHGVNVLLALYLMILLLRRRSGLYRNPRGIGNLASLICQSNIQNLFQQIPSYTRNDVLKSALSGYKFRLRHVSVTNPTQETPDYAYQLVVESPDLRINLRPDYSYCPVISDANSIWLRRRTIGLAYIFFLVSFGLILTAIYNAAKFLLSSTTASAIEPTAAKIAYLFCITVAAMVWQSTQREIHLLEPWRKLAYGHGSKLHYDLISMGLIASTLYSAVKFGFIACWIGLAHLTMQLAEIFLPPIIEIGYESGYRLKGPTVSNDSQLPKVMQGATSWPTVGVGIAIEVIIFINVLVYMFSGRHKPILPRRPRTIASQVLYLCRSRRLLDDFQGTSMLDEKSVAARLDAVGRSCKFGWFWWAENQYFLGVEEDSGYNVFLPFDYQHGTSSVPEPL
jgi:hypothetical protein